MAHKRKGMVITSDEWKKHLNKLKPAFWRAHRRAEKALVRETVWKEVGV